MLHGTLAHGRMETMAAVQDLLAERGFNTLSVNLSYGIDAREGMFACDRPITQGLQGHFGELEAWMGWLREAGYGPVTLLGHSRGGNQVARFSPGAHARGGAGPGVDRAEHLRRRVGRQPATRRSPGCRCARVWIRPRSCCEWVSPRRCCRMSGFSTARSWMSHPAAFLDYYHPEPEHDTPTVIEGIELPTLVIIGSEDDVVADLPERIAALEQPIGCQTVTVDGADHFFRDFFADDVVEAAVDFLE
jgi:hypothetical protein